VAEQVLSGRRGGQAWRAQAVSPDGATLYVSTPGAIAKVDLSTY